MTSGKSQYILTTRRKFIFHQIQIKSMYDEHPCDQIQITSEKGRLAGFSAYLPSARAADIFRIRPPYSPNESRNLTGTEPAFRAGFAAAQRRQLSEFRPRDSRKHAAPYPSAPEGRSACKQNRRKIYMRLLAQIVAALRGFRSPSHRCAPARAERLFHMNATRAPFTLISARNRNPPDGRAASSLCCALPAALLSGSSRKIEARPFRAARLPLKYQLCRASPSRNEQSSEICPRK